MQFAAAHPYIGLTAPDAFYYAWTAALGISSKPAWVTGHLRLPIATWLRESNPEAFVGDVPAHGQKISLQAEYCSTYNATRPPARLPALLTMPPPTIADPPFEVLLLCEGRQWRANIRMRFDAANRKDILHFAARCEDMPKMPSTDVNDYQMRVAFGSDDIMPDLGSKAWCELTGSKSVRAVIGADWRHDEQQVWVLLEYKPQPPPSPATRTLLTAMVVVPYRYRALCLLLPPPSLSPPQPRTFSAAVLTNPFTATSPTNTCAFVSPRGGVTTGVLLPAQRIGSKREEADECLANPSCSMPSQTA